MKKALKPIEPEQSWFQRAAEKVVRERKNLAMVLLELGVGDVKSSEADQIYRSKAFQEILRAERHRFWNELATDPGFGKQSAAGQMLDCIQNLMTEGHWDKALDGLNKLAAMMGWKSADTNVNVFQGITAKDIESVKTKLGLKPQDANGRPQEAN